MMKFVDLENTVVEAQIEVALSEVEAYMLLPQINEGTVFDLLKWWKRRSEVWPNLARMARHYLCLCAASGVVERAFLRME